MPIQHYEKGPYRAKVTGQRFGVTPNKSPYIALEFEPTESTGANHFPETVYKRELSLYCTQASIEYTLQKLRRLGWNGDSFAELDPSREDFHSFEGAEISVVCDYNEKGYEEWNLAAPGGGAREENNGEVASKLDKMFGKALKASAKPKASKPAETVPADDDEEAPF